MRLLRTRKRPTCYGVWTDRYEDVLASGVEFGGRSVLDAGCNVGIVAYEIAKRGPAFIHGVDVDGFSVKAAREIFHAVPVKSRFERLNLTRPKSLAAALDRSYDVVLLLSVYQPIQKKVGTERANGMVSTLAERCREHFIVRVGEGFRDMLTPPLRAAGFSLSYDGVRERTDFSPISIFSRERPSTTA
jgi:SAM-dependent methyltransferase